MKATSAPRPTLWLRLAQVGWVILAAVTLFLTLASVPPFFAALHHVLPTTDATDFGGQLTASASLSGLDALGLSLDFYARYTTALTLFIWLLFAIVGLVIFVRRANDRVALVAAYALILAPIAINTDILLALPAIWLPLILTLQFIGQISLMLLFYLFPSGRFAPDWTRWVFILGFIYWAVDIYAPVSVSNSILFFIAFLALELSLVIAQIARYRRVSTPVQRQQTKWVVFGVAIALTGFLALTFITPLVFRSTQSFAFSVPSFLAASYIVMLLVPLSLAIAMLRHRLYDVDLLINRTLVYGSLTAILFAIYIVSVITVQAIITAITGNRHESPLAIVASTLLAVALFQPLRLRIQRIIDRRFYRSQYNAARTLEKLAAGLRQEVDLQALSAHLLQVVKETMQPTHLSLWLRPRDPITDQPTSRRDEQRPS